MIAVLDYGIGNLRSAEKALQQVGGDARLVADPAETEGANPKKCTWTIYKSIEAIPAEAYKRIGMQKPS